MSGIFNLVYLYMYTQRIIAGTMKWGVGGKNLPNKQLAELIAYYVEQGVSLFDCADIYGNFSTEQAVGEALKASAIERSSIQLISKCGIQAQSEQRGVKVKHYNYDAHYILQQVEQSLNKLNTDYLDVLLLHRPSPLMDPNEIAAVVNQLKERGSIKHFGVSNFTATQLLLLKKHLPVDVNQIECSLLQPQALFNGLLDVHQTENVATMAWSPLGKFFTAESEQQKRVAAVLHRLEKKYAYTSDQLLLAWLCKHPAKMQLVIGTTDHKRIKQSIEATKCSLELEDWFELLQASRGHDVA